jgi:hypothetical protein
MQIQPLGNTHTVLARVHSWLVSTGSPLIMAASIVSPLTVMATSRRASPICTWEQFASPPTMLGISMV